jgi:sugar lactone lactonase YvrE
MKADDRPQIDDPEVRLNGIATSPDGTTIYVTVTDRPDQVMGGVLAVPAF